jgi:hypothetical protein
VVGSRRTSEKVKGTLVHKRGRKTNMTDCISSLYFFFYSGYQNPGSGLNPAASNARSGSGSNEYESETLSATSVEELIIVYRWCAGLT